jgi:DNA-binding NtrC family response regulator
MEAIVLAAEHRGFPHPALSDMVLPEMNEPEVFARIHDVHPEFRALCMPGYTGKVIVNEGILKSRWAYIP